MLWYADYGASFLRRAPGNVGEYGNATVEIDTTSKLFAGLDNGSLAFYVMAIMYFFPVGFEAVAKTDDFSVFAFENKEKAYTVCGFI